MDLWTRYGLVETRGKTGMGKVKRDLAMLFLARCFDLYLKPKGRHAFLMPFTVFKTQAGAGFRKFLATRARISVIHDLVTTYPFEGAANRTSVIVVEKLCELGDIERGKCPEISKTIKENKKIKHVIWLGEKPVPTDMPLEEALKIVRRNQAIMTPIIERDPSSFWMRVTEKVLPHIRKLIGASPYEAHAGVYVGLNQIYYIRIRQILPNGNLFIENPPKPGQKKRVKHVQEEVKPDHVYPLIRGRDVKKWHVD